MTGPKSEIQCIGFRVQDVLETGRATVGCRVAGAHGERLHHACDRAAARQQRAACRTKTASNTFKTASNTLQTPLKQLQTASNTLQLQTPKKNSFKHLAALRVEYAV